uniref:RPAP1_C domain-containing protein n=1 Tax=Macrostomum lignano TaxID=282301 RepID=A0A1I8F4Y3_9PLAT
PQLPAASSRQAKKDAATGRQSQQQQAAKASSNSKKSASRKQTASQSVPSESAATTPRLESEKLAWTRDPQLPVPKLLSASQARLIRICLASLLALAMLDLPTHLGLHHHGDEPHRAGYSVPELFTAGPVHRAAAAVSRVHHFGQAACLDQPAGLRSVFLCRVALDDAKRSSRLASKSRSGLPSSRSIAMRRCRRVPFRPAFKSGLASPPFKDFDRI